MTVRDMMEINRRLLKEELKLDKVYAILGEQLGGMQALQWMIAYPDEMEKVIAVTTTPKTDAWDYLGWQSQADILSRPRMTREDDQWAAMATGSVLAHMVFGPPIRADAFAQNTKQTGGAQSLLGFAQTFLLNYGLDRQALYARAIANHNAYKGYGDTVQKAADRAKAKLLAFVLPDDLYTSTLPMLELARLMNARVVELNKGLIEPNIGSESPLLQKEIQSFLTQ
jgi:homoserine O-acetyltransferase